MSSEDVDENNLLKATYSFVFGSPKSFLHNEKCRNMLHSNVYHDRTFTIVVDCHRKKLVPDRHVITELPLVPFVIKNLMTLTPGVCKKVRFKPKVIRGFSFSPLLSHGKKSSKTSRMRVVLRPSCL